MAIIIRDQIKLPNGNKTMGKRYVSDIAPLPGYLRREAEENDVLIGTKVKQIEDELERQGLLGLRRKADVLKLWYELGKGLAFVDKMKLSPTARKYVWRAIYDHSSRVYPDKETTPVRIRERPINSELHYSYIIGKFDWAFVESAGNWTAWVEFLDSIAMREDPRIIEWIQGVQSRTPLQGGFLRELNKAIRNRLKGFEARDMSLGELTQILDETYRLALSGHAQE